MTTHHGEPAPGWLACADCASTIYESWTGEAPGLVLTIEVQHSETCPSWRSSEREFALQFLPQSQSNQGDTND